MKYATAEFIVYYIFIPLNIISFLLRDRKPFNAIWRVLLCFWIALGLAVVIQNIQDGFKKK